MVVVKLGYRRRIQWLISAESERITSMPSLFRFLTVVAVIAGIVYGTIFALANFVNPKPREMTINVAPDKFLKK